MSSRDKHGAPRVGDLVLGPGPEAALITRSGGEALRRCADIEYYVLYKGSLARGTFWDRHCDPPFPLLSR